VYLSQDSNFWHPVITSEIHSYLKNSNSTFFLIYAYDYEQHTTSPSFTYSILKKTQPKCTAFCCTVTRLPSSQTRIINRKIKNSRILKRQPIHGTKTHGSEFRRSMLIRGGGDF